MSEDTSTPVLVVDADATACGVIARLLEHNGHRAVALESAEEALRCDEQVRPVLAARRSRHLPATERP